MAEVAVVEVVGIHSLNRGKKCDGLGRVYTDREICIPGSARVNIVDSRSIFCFDPSQIYINQ